jgi:hypothetical protein
LVRSSRDFYLRISRCLAELILTAAQVRREYLIDRRCADFVAGDAICRASTQVWDDVGEIVNPVAMQLPGACDETAPLPV